MRLSSEILLTRGHIYPATTSNIELEALWKTAPACAAKPTSPPAKSAFRSSSSFPPDVDPLPQTLDAIAQADIITIGPGSLFTSLIPNLLVHGIADAIVNSPAIKVYICNLMTQANESLGPNRRRSHPGPKPPRPRANLRLRPDQPHARSAEMKAKYALEGASQIVIDLDAIEALGVIPVLGDYLEEAGVARHDTARIASDIMQLTTQTIDADRKTRSTGKV